MAAFFEALRPDIRAEVAKVMDEVTVFDLLVREAQRVERVRNTVNSLNKADQRTTAENGVSNNNRSNIQQPGIRQTYN